jgi:hypothetical protein
MIILHSIESKIMDDSVLQSPTFPTIEKTSTGKRDANAAVYGDGSGISAPVPYLTALKSRSLSWRVFREKRNRFQFAERNQKREAIDWKENRSWSQFQN